MRKIVDFLFVYEVKAREFENICLIAAQLENMGYTTAFVNSWNAILNPKIKKVYKSKVVIISAGYNSAVIKYFVSHAADFNYVVNMQWEQLMTSELVDNEDYIWFFKGLAHKIKHFSWGEWNYDRLVNICKVPSENIEIVGNTTLDLFRNNFNDYFINFDNKYKEYGLDKYDQVSLFVSSFTLINIPEDVEESIATAMEITETKIISEKSQKQIIDWFIKYLNENPNKAIIYRPHPTEFHNNDLIELSEKIDNFYLISDSSIKPWIKKCDKIYTWFSTAVGEIYASNKSCYILRPEKWVENQDLVIYEDAEFITTYDDFLKSENSNDHYFPISDDIMKQFYQISETPAYKKIANSLSSIIENNIVLDEETKKEIQFPENSNLMLKAYFAFNETIFAKILNYFAFKTNIKILQNRKNLYLNDKKNKIDEYTMQMINSNYASEIEIRDQINKFKQFIN